MIIHQRDLTFGAHCLSVSMNQCLLATHFLGRPRKGAWHEKYKRNMKGEYKNIGKMNRFFYYYLEVSIFFPHPLIMYLIKSNESECRIENINSLAPKWRSGNEFTPCVWFEFPSSL